MSSSLRDMNYMDWYCNESMLAILNWLYKIEAFSWGLGSFAYMVPLKWVLAATTPKCGFELQQRQRTYVYILYQDSPYRLLNYYLLSSLSLTDLSQLYVSALAAHVMGFFPYSKKLCLNIKGWNCICYRPRSYNKTRFLFHLHGLKFQIQGIHEMV